MSVPIVNISSLEHGAWLLWAGLGLTWLGVLFVSTIQPSSDGKFIRSHRDQKSFLIGCELPLLLGSVLLTTYWAWYRNTRAGDPLPELTIFVLLGIGLHFLSWVPYMFIQLPRLIKAIKQLGALVLAIVLAGAAGGLFLGLLTTLIPAFSNPRQAAKFYVCFATPALLSALLLVKTLFVGLFSRYSDDNDREWWARAGGWILIAIVGWSAISVLVMYGPDGLALLPATVTMLLGGSSGVATFMLGRSAQTPANLKQQTELTGKLKDRVNLKDVTLKLASPLFAAFLIALLSFATNAVIASLTMQSVFEINWEPRVFVYIVSFSLAMLALGAVMASFINVNKFSLHAAYRNRLIRAYLGASNKTRDPNPFTGFDPEDNIAMHELGVKKPFHVVNMALNLVRGKNLAWQQRKAESFTVTPLHAGSYRVGYRRSQDYGKGDKGESISLGTAVAISGAAASPNMGYHSSPGITFLLTLFNARLGWWLGNPGAAGQRTYDRAYPKFAIGPLLAETFGLTDDQSRYIYLSDGGHFENLGLYEMVLRRCRFIVLSDAGQDAEYTFEDLGNAIRKIRIDLGIPIEMQEVQACIYSRSREKQGKCCAIGTIKYSCVDEGAEDGHLLYLKPTFYGNEPIDIYNYAQTNKAFPHEPTFDQWFSESQLESYRMLGFNTVRAVFEGSKPSDSQLPLTDLDALRRRALEYLSAS